MEAQAVYFTGPREVQIRQIEVPDPEPGQVQIRVLANGICMMEVVQYAGIEPMDYPGHAGHEGIGIVQKVGKNVKTLKEGDYVQAFKWSTLENRWEGQLRPFVPPPDDPAAYLTEPPSCVVTAWREYGIDPGDRVLVIGAGYMGLLNVQMLAHSPIAELVVADVKELNLKLAAQMGATETIHAGTPEGDARLQELEAKPFDLVVEAAGVESCLQQAGSLTRAGGRIGVFSWHHEPRTIDFGQYHVKGLKVMNVGPRIGTDWSGSAFHRAIALMNAGTIDQHQLITHRHHFTDVEEAMTLALERPEGYIKGVLTFDD